MELGSQHQLMSLDKRFSYVVSNLTYIALLPSGRCFLVFVSGGQASYITGCFIASQPLHLFCCVPAFVLLGASAKSRCFKKLPHPSLPSRQVQILFFFSKIAITTKSSFFHGVPIWTQNIPWCPKQEQNWRHSACHNHFDPSRWLLPIRNCCLVPCCTWYRHRTSSKCTGLPCCLVWFCATEICSNSGKLSISHLRPTLNVYEWCMNVNNNSLGLSPCQRYLEGFFW